MAEELSDKALQAIESLKKKTEEAGITIKAFDEFVAKTTKTLGLSAAETERVNKVIVNLKEEINRVININWSGELKSWGQALDSVKNKIYELSPGLTNLAVDAALLSPALTSRTKDVVNSFNIIGSSAKGMSAEINSAFTTTLNLLPAMVGKSDAAKYLAQLSVYAESGKRMEMGLLHIASSSGQLSSMLGKAGEGVSDLSRRSEAYSDLTRKIGDDTGYLSHQVSEYAQQLMQIPGAFEEIQVGDQRMHNLRAAMVVATGTGQDFKDVMQDISFVYEHFGIKGAPALEFTTRLQAASEHLGIPLKYIKDYTNNAANSFALYANNMKDAATLTQGTINIIEDLGPALQKSGLGPKAVGDLVKGVTDGISRMDTAQKAFLSAQTGGPGGLQGAFQIDQMISEGKIDQVFDKVKQNMMQKLGGPIVTRAEAAASPQAAAQMQKQISFMMSPSMGGIAKDQASAIKLLEAMVTSGKGSKEFTDKDTAMKTALDRGTKIQERGNNILVQIANATARTKDLQEIIAYSTARKTFGAENQAFTKDLRDAREMSRGAAALDPFKGTGKYKGRSVDELIKEANPGKELAKMVAKSGDYVMSAGRHLMNAGKNKEEPIPGAPVIGGQRKISPTGSAPPNIGKMAARNIRRAEMYQQQSNQAAEEQPQNVNVSVQTVCSVCQRKVASDEAGKAIEHYHDKNVKKAFMGTP